jgi:hypothetical protein
MFKFFNIYFYAEVNFIVGYLEIRLCQLEDKEKKNLKYVN